MQGNGGGFFSPNQKRIFNRQGVGRDRSQLYFSLKLSYARIFAIYLLALRSHLIFSFSTSLQTGPVTNRGKDHLYRTNIGDCCGPRLIWLLCAEFSESIFALAPLSPLSALALALPVRLRTFGERLAEYELLTPRFSICCGATAVPCPGGYLGMGARMFPGGDGRPAGDIPFGDIPLGGIPFGDQYAES
jgi:hypothetical protein